MSCNFLPCLRFVAQLTHAHAAACHIAAAIRVAEYTSS